MIECSVLNAKQYLALDLGGKNTLRQLVWILVND